MAAAQEKYVGAKALPKDIFAERLEMPRLLWVTTVDGVVDTAAATPAMVEADIVKVCNRLKREYAETVGEGHYVACTVSVMGEDGNGNWGSVGKSLLAWEDGVRTLVRIPTPTAPKADKAAPKTKAKPKAATAKAKAKPASAKTTASKRTTAKRKPVTRKATPKTRRKPVRK